MLIQLKWMKKPNEGFLFTSEPGCEALDYYYFVNSKITNICVIVFKKERKKKKKKQLFFCYWHTFSYKGVWLIGDPLRN